MNKSDAAGKQNRGEDGLRFAGSVDLSAALKSSGMGELLSAGAGSELRLR